MPEVADLYVVLRSVGRQFEEGMGRAGAAAGTADSRIAGVGRSIKMMSLAALGGGLLVAGAAVKMSSEFDRLMEQLHTLAHVPQAELKGLSSSVLRVAGDVGFAPNSLASALYHVESTFASTGINGKKAIDILTTAAKGAQIGGADLVDVVNALDAAVVSGIPGVKNIHQAMGALLATVGAGDMTMQNLADALGTGILAVAKQYGPTLADVGAALATFGDNNIRGSKAATDLRMVIMDLTKQSTVGVKALKKIGITAGELGKDMQTGGLNKAMLDLHAHLEKAGIRGTQVGQTLADAFTKRSSAPLAILLGELGQFESKYPELKKGANEFGDAWKHTAALISTRAKMAKDNIEAAFIGLGHMLAPIASQILNVFNKGFSWVKTHKAEVEKLAHTLKTVLLGALIVIGVVLGEMAVEAAIAAAPFILISLAVGMLAKKLYSLYEHNAKFREFVNNLVTAFKKDAVAAVHWLINAFHEAKKVIGEVIGAVIGFYDRHKAAIDGMVQDVITVLRDIWTAFQDGFDAVKAVVQTAVKIVEDLWDRFGSHIWGHVVTAWHAIVQVIRGALQIIKGIFQMITGILTGNWSKFWHGLMTVVDGVWNVISGIVKAGVNFISTIIGAGMAVISAAWGLIWHTIAHLAENAWSGIKKVGSFLFKWFVDLPLNIVLKIGNAAAALFSVGENFIWGLLRGIGHMVGKLWDWAMGMPKKVFDILDGIYQQMLTVGENLVTGIWNGIAKMADWLYNKVADFCSSIWNGILNFFGISSPSKLMRDTVGKHLVTGIAQGIADNKHVVHAQMKKLATELSNQKINVGVFSHGPSAGGPGSGAMGSVGAGQGNTYYHFTVQGSVVDTQGLFRAMQAATQRHGARNPSNGLVYKR